MHILSLFLWLFYVWMAAQTPYGIDDWSWGLPIGIERWLTASLNSRYVGNLFEIVVSRSSVLKAVLTGSVAAALPVGCVLFTASLAPAVEKSGQEETGKPFLLLAATILFLTVPKAVWRQTYGWIAGFSNHGLSSLLLICFQFLLLRCTGECREEKALFSASSALYFLFGVTVQLVVENVSCYILFVTAAAGLGKLLKKEKTSPCFTTLLLGVLCGTALMFSSGIYGSLLHTGKAMDGLRSISVNTEDGVFSGVLSLYRRFVYIYPANIWGNNWLICSVISILLLIFWSKTTLGHQWLRWLFSVGYGLWFFYFICVQLFGPLEDHISRWNYVLTQRINLLFFWTTLFSTIFLFRIRPRFRNVLIGLWLSAPLIVLPLAATELDSGASRCYLVCIVFLIEYTLSILTETAEGLPPNRRKQIQLAAAVILLSLAVQKGIIYHNIGDGKREREALIRKAKAGELTEISFPDYPYGDYLWTMEPLGEEQRNYYREFYRIPDNVVIRFNTGEFEETEEGKDGKISDQ